MTKWSVALALLMLTSFCFPADAAVHPVNLKCEYRSNPVGIDILSPRLSWELTSQNNGERQTAYRILVASSQQLLDANTGDVWDTKRVDAERSVNVVYNGRPLKSGQKYFWKVQAWGKDGAASEWSAPSFWSVGLLRDDEWKAQWIGLDRPVGADDTTEFTRLSARYLRKEFRTEKEIERATVHICGLGLYELSINGRKVGDDVLVPAQTQFNKTLLYNTYDVTELLREGANAVGVILGNGRYFTMRKSNMANFGFPRLLLQMHLTYRDGSAGLLVSDGTWKITADGPITENNEYDGEKYDARKEMKGWNETGFDESKWMPVELLDKPAARLSAQVNEPIRVTETLKPVSVKEILPGVHIFDMGQNMVGWVRLRVKGDTGTTVRLRFAESLDADSLYMANIRGAKVTDVYVCRGDGQEEWEPRFTYHGFRFVEMTGFPGTPDIAAIEGKVVHDDVASIGTFSCSNENMNQIFRNAVWGIRGNYRSFPTDCPQRDERHGWLGDRAMGSRGESFVFNIASLYAKWMRDIVDAQRGDGSIPDVCPAFWDLYSDNVTWDGTPIVLLDMLLTQYANEEAVRQAYPGMKKWHDYMTRRYMKNGLMPRDTYGDWCVPPDEPETIHTSDPYKITAGTYIGSAYFYFLTGTMQRFAALLGKKEDERSFGRQAARMKDAFNKAYFNKKTRTYSNNSATANILALAFDLVPARQRQRVVDNLIEVTETRFRGHVPTGLVGAQFLMRTLTQVGRADLAYRFATQTDYPSWGYMIRSGATTIWELWNGNTADPAMNSQNHVMLLGDLLTWYYENLAGIKSSATQTGFKHIIMEPTLISGLDAVNASHNSPYGVITSKWNLTSGRFTWDVTVPVNATATVRLPAGRAADVLVNGRPAAESEEVTVRGMKDGRLLVEVPSGKYSFSAAGFTVVTPPKVVATPRVENKELSADKPIQLGLLCDTEGATIRYTMDGRPPTEKSRVYSGALEVAKSAIVRARAFKDGFEESYEMRAEVEIHPPRIPVQNITHVTRYSMKHPPANGDRALIDMQEGSTTYSDKRWVGYEANDLEVILDLGKPVPVRNIRMRFLSAPASWVFLPKGVQVSAGNSTEQLMPVANARYGEPPETPMIRKEAIPLKNVKARYLKIKVQNTGKCPDWHSVPGGDAWMFTDEIFVE